MPCHNAMSAFPQEKNSHYTTVNNQYLTVLLCWGDLPRPRVMVLPLYSKLVVQFQKLGYIIYY